MYLHNLKNKQKDFYLFDNVNKNWNILSFIKVEFMAELCWIILLHCTGVPNVVASI